MKYKEPITAEEFWRQKYRPETKILTGEEHIVFDAEDVREYAILFAKYHVKEALKQASEKAEGNYDCTVEKDSILNAYPETNIK